MKHRVEKPYSVKHLRVNIPVLFFFAVIASQRCEWNVAQMSRAALPACYRLDSTEGRV